MMNHLLQMFKQRDQGDEETLRHNHFLRIRLARTIASMINEGHTSVSITDPQQLSPFTYGTKKDRRKKRMRMERLISSFLHDKSLGTYGTHKLGICWTLRNDSADTPFMLEVTISERAKALQH